MRTPLNNEPTTEAHIGAAAAYMEAAQLARQVAAAAAKEFKDYARSPQGAAIVPEDCPDDMLDFIAQAAAASLETFAGMMEERAAKALEKAKATYALENLDPSKAAQAEPA